MTDKPKSEPKWKQFEKIVAEIQRQLAPNALVKHNHRVRGKSGRKRQLDVTISQKIGLVPIFIAIECKRYKKPVGIEKVEAFVQKLRDVGASLPGVMISVSGFDEGAKAVSIQENIMLLTYREAVETDWGGLFGVQAWIKIIAPSKLKFDSFTKFIGHSEYQKTSLNTLVYDGKEVINTIRGVFDTVWPQYLEQTKVPAMGNVEFTIETSDVFVNHEGKLVEIVEILIRGQIIAREYIVNLFLAEGKILETIDSQKPLYRELVSSSFNWREVIQNYPGVEITQQDLDAKIAEGHNFQLIDFDPQKLQDYLRIVYTERNID